jgi:hypothetical protein
MEIYIATFVCLLILKEVPNFFGRMDRTLNSMIGMLAFAALLWLAAFRINTGTDFDTYAQIWDRTLVLSKVAIDDVFFGYLEPLFVATNLLLKTMSDSRTLFFASYALLTLYPLHRAIKSFRVNQAHAYVVYFSIFYLPYALNAMRQAVAMSLLLVALKYILTGRKYIVWLIALIAGGFHFTGFLILVIYYANQIFSKKNWKPESVLLIGLPCAIAIGQLGMGGKIFFALFEYKFETYAELFSETTSISSMAFRIGLAMILVVGARASPTDRPLRQLINIYLLGLFFYFGLSEFNMLATRFNMFFRVMEVIIIPLVGSRQRGARWILVYVLTSGLLFATLWAIANEPDYKYRSIFSFFL